MILTGYRPADCRELAELFYDTVHTINAGDYTEEQLTAWADGTIDLKRWNQSFLEHYSIVARSRGVITGFGDIDNTGYLDRLYVHKDYQHQGIASAICNVLEQAVPANKIVVHASITAKPFFLSRGYNIIKKQQVVRHGISLTNYMMEKRLEEA